MPEGPEVETIRRSLDPLVVGRTLGRAWRSSKKLRTKVAPRAFAQLDGARVVATGRKGKLMWLEVDGGGGLFVRLGMSGKLYVTPRDEAVAPHTHLRLPLDPDVHGHAAREIRYVDARRFGDLVPFASEDEKQAELLRMGPDALSWDAADRAIAAGIVRKTKRSLKDALLDQSVLAGVGNIYAAEALFLARLSPFRTGASLSPTEVDALLTAVTRVLADSVGRRGTSFNDYVDGLGVPGDNLAHLFVFQREGEPCRVCSRPVARVTQGARSTFFCQRCQRATRR